MVAVHNEKTRDPNNPIQSNPGPDWIGLPNRLDGLDWIGLDCNRLAPIVRSNRGRSMGGSRVLKLVADPKAAILKIVRFLNHTTGGPCTVITIGPIQSNPDYNPTSADWIGLGCD
jgi:hypothetical protein